jgi:hypothetical protein
VRSYTKPSQYGGPYLIVCTINTHSLSLSQYCSHGNLFFSVTSSPSVVVEGWDSGHQSGEPQSRRMLISSTWRRYAKGLVRDDLAAPDNGVKDNILAALSNA